MPVIYMKHAVHGAKVANMEAEAVADEANGWVRYTLDTPTEEVVAPVNVLEVKRRRKVVTEEA
jgi:hypothetical protein